MAGNLQPLDQKFKVVNPDGTPTEYFIRWAQQKQIDIGTSLTLQDLQDYLDAHQIVAGVGIQFAPGPNGNLNQNPVIHADAQAILDEITATRGAVLYRGLGGWAALLPGTAGYLLSTNGAGADPAWIAPSGGGGHPWFLSPPLASRFTLSNGGGATNMTLTDDTDVGLIFDPNTFAGASLSHAFALENVPGGAASNFTLTARCEGSSNNEFEYNGFGLCLYESATDKFIAFYHMRDYGTPGSGSIAVDYWNSPSSFNSDQRLMRGVMQLHWRRVVHTGGNYLFQVSATGKRWITILTVADTAFLAGKADKVGFLMGSSRNTDIYWQFSCQNYSLV